MHNYYFVNFSQGAGSVPLPERDGKRAWGLTVLAQTVFFRCAPPAAANLFSCAVAAMAATAQEKNACELP